MTMSMMMTLTMTMTMTMTMTIGAIGGVAELWPKMAKMAIYCISAAVGAKMVGKKVNILKF